MHLQLGRQLGPYEIVSLLGAGGMGEVYRAHDSRLGRTVAIKVLPAGLTSTPAQRIRFEREARAIAALSHPNICAVHDVGSADGIEYLVMECLEGETLADRIAQGPLPLTLVLRYGAQIADGLQHAHRAGITHRDLKPGNIMLSPAGAKLLDFGLAKSLAPTTAGDDQPTQVAPVTAEGMVVGTLQYMAPEQLQGKPVDHRADIFALGAILYEMVTGRRAFNGTSSPTIIASILSTDPPAIRSVQPSVPAALDRIITNALEKDPDERWQTAHDVARQLRWVADAPTASAEQPSAPQKMRFGAALLAFLLGAAIASLLVFGAMRAIPAAREAVPRTMRFDLAMPAGLTPAAALGSDAERLAPDGRTLCYVASAGGHTALYVRDLDSWAARKVEGTEDAIAPFWSSDGAWIGFSARGKLWKTRRSGDTPPESLCDVGVTGAAASWSGSTILFSEEPPGRPNIFRVASSGGVAVAVTKPAAGEWRHGWPHFLADGKHFLYSVFPMKTINRTVNVTALDGAAGAVLLRNVSQVRNVGADRLIYVRDGKLLAQRYDAAAGTLDPEVATVADDIAYFYPTGHADFDAVASGMVVYRTNTSASQLSVVARDGVEQRLLDAESGRFFDVALSPDGKQAAATIFSRSTGLGDIWLYDIARGARDRFTSDAGMEFSPVFSRDGASIIYAEAQGGSVPYVVTRALNAATSQTLTAPGPFRYPRSLSPDGKTLFVVEENARTGSDIHQFSMDTRTDVPFLVTDFAEAEPAVSPDGTLLAYSSDATGRLEIYVQQLTAGKAGRVLVSTRGGSAPRWSSDGSELFYVGADARTVYVAHSASRGWNDAKSDPLFIVPKRVQDFMPLPGNATFLLIQTSEGAADQLFHVITGWR